MAKSHVIQYFLEVESQYLELVENLDELKALLGEGKITIDDYDSLINDIQRSKDNYERISYIMFLLNKPQRKGKKEDKSTIEWYNALQYASKEALLDESKDVLAKVKQLIKEGKIGNV